MKETERLRDLNLEVGFKPFLEVRLWTLLSSFGEGKEDFLDYITDYFKGSFTIKLLSYEKLKAIPYVYTDKRMMYITEMERIPFLVITLEEDEKIWKFLSSIIKTRLRDKRFLTVILSDLDRETFDKVFPGLTSWGLVNYFKEENTITRKRDDILKETFKEKSSVSNFLDGVEENEST